MRAEDFIEADDTFDMAVEWFRGGNHAKAESCLKHTIELNPRFIYAYVILARLYGVQKRYADAVHVLKRASKLDPDFDRLNFLMAKYARRAGDFKTALSSIDRALAVTDEPLYRMVRDFLLADRG